MDIIIKQADKGGAVVIIETTIATKSKSRNMKIRAQLKILMEREID